MKPEDRKKIYEAPEAEVIRFEEEDVIITSTQTKMPPANGSSMFNLF